VGENVTSAFISVVLDQSRFKMNLDYHGSSVQTPILIHHADSPAPDNPTLISDSRSVVLQTSVDPIPDPPSGLVTFRVRPPFSTPHLYLSPASWGLIPQFEDQILPESLVLVRLQPKLQHSEIFGHIVT
jgi:hypothetical protein